MVQYGSVVIELGIHGNFQNDFVEGGLVSLKVYYILGNHSSTINGNINGKEMVNVDMQMIDFGIVQRKARIRFQNINNI